MNDHYYQWMIVLKSSGEPIGCISGMSQDDDLASVEMGYCIGGRGGTRGL